MISTLVTSAPTGTPTTKALAGKGMRLDVVGAGHGDDAEHREKIGSARPRGASRNGPAA